jgi:hypothetical protein
MFGTDDTMSGKVADYLEKSVRLFRAAGIHFILASQSISGNLALYGKTDTLFSQIPIRIAHKNSVIESVSTLGGSNSAAAFIRSREAIINVEYGEPTQNKKTSVAFADEKYLSQLRYQWWSMAKGYTKPPYVFDSSRRANISDSVEKMLALRDEFKISRALIGADISVADTPVAIPLPDESGRNIAILGASTDEKYNTATGIMQSIAISLAVQDKKGTANFVLCNFLKDEEINASNQSMFIELMKRLGYYVEQIEAERFHSYINQKFDALADYDTDEKTYIFVLGLDKWEYEKDPYSLNPPLKNFLEKAPNKGIHFIGWWVKISNFSAQAKGHGDASAFNTKIFLRADEREIQGITNPFVRWSPQPNRALVYDEVSLSEPKVFVPYSPVTSEDVSIITTKLS